MIDSWQRRFGGFARGAGGDRRTGRGGSPRRRHSRLHHESLEQRKLLAITVVPGGGVSNSLIVATSPDASDAAADDVFITRSAAGRLLVGTDSSFTGTQLTGNYDTPSILFVTNGEGQATPGPMQPGDNRSIGNGGLGYQQDTQSSTRTTFVLKNGGVRVPSTSRDVSLRPIVDAFPPNGNQAAFPYERINRLRGTVAYDGGEWEFEMDVSARVWIWEVTPPASGVRPLSASLNAGFVDDDSTSAAISTNRYAGAGLRATFDFIWSSSVATVTHAAVTQSGSAIAQPPVLRSVDYSWGIASRAAGDNLGFAESETIVMPSAEARSGVQFDVGSYLAGGGFANLYDSGQMIAGTLRGTLRIDSYGSGPASAVRGLAIPFTADIRDDVGGPLYFDGLTQGEVDWVVVSGRWTPTGQISVSFENYYAGSDFLPADGSRSQLRGPVKPGPISFSDVSFIQYANPVQPSDFTLWAGYDLPSQLRADLRSSGSVVNIDSPVIVGAPAASSDVTDIDIRATAINVNARVQSRDNLFIGASRAGNPSEVVTIDANIAVPNTVDINVADDPNTLDAMRGQLLVSQTGSIGSTFTNAPPPFGSAGTVFTAEAEPNDNRAEANDLAASFRPLGNDIYQTSITGAVTPRFDPDFYTFQLRPFDTLEVRVAGLTLNDPVLRLEDAQGRQLTFNDDYFGLNPFVRYVNGGAPLDVFVRVTGYGSFSPATGSYRMDATVYGTPTPPTATVLVSADTSDVFIEGQVIGTNQSYLMRSTDAVQDRAPFVFTTTSPRTGADVGKIRGGTLQVLLANDADSPIDQSISYNKCDLSTAVNSLRVRASIKQNGVETSAFGPFPYELSIREEDDITIDAVAASSRKLGFMSDGPMRWTAALNTSGDLAISTRNLSPGYSSFTASAPITTFFGKIDIHASDMTLGSTVAVSMLALQDPTRTDIALTAENGSILVNGVLRSPNGIDVVQRGKGPDRVAGIGRVKTGTVSFNATAVGRSDLSPTDTQFFLRTDVDSITAEVQDGFAIDELNDVSIPYLRSPNGIVAVRAGGYDDRPGSVNGPAITASMVDVGSLYVSAPNGSIDVRNDTAKRVQLGVPTALANGTVGSMLAGGSVTIISSAGGFDVYDAPVAGSGARRADAATGTILTGAIYAKGSPGQTASTLTARGFGALQSNPAFAAAGRVLRVGDRVLVKNGLRRPSGTRNDLVNGVYEVRSLGGATSAWRLVRAADSDAFEELPTNTVVYDADKGTHWRLQHSIVSRANFGNGAISVQGAADGYDPLTTIASSLVVPANDVRFVVSSSDGSNTGAGSLGKMILLRQENQPVDPTQVQSVAFSRLLTQPIVLREALPQVTVPLVLDANGPARVLPLGTTGVGVPAIVVNGQLISRTANGSALYRGTTSATIARADQNPVLKTTKVKLTPSFPNVAELRVGMSVSGNGIRPGTRVAAIVTSPTGAEITVDNLTDVIFNSVTNEATVSLTFATELNGFDFAPSALGSRLASVNIGGFESGAAVKVAAPGVILDQVNIGSNGASVPNRLGNQVGVLVTDSGSAALVGGQVTSNSVAGVKTEKQASVSVVGTIVGTQNLANIVGLDLGGRSATVGIVSSITQPIAPDTFVQFNRRGIVVRSGVTKVQNTTVASNSFEGIAVEAGGVSDSTTIGNVSRGRTRTGQNVADSNYLQTNGTWGLHIQGTALAKTNVFDNVFGSDPSRTTIEANKSGNVAIDGTLAGQPFVPNVITGLDANGNQHGLKGAATPSSATGTRPWQPRS
jgi:hypothetical protein